MSFHGAQEVCVGNIGPPQPCGATGSDRKLFAVAQSPPFALDDVVARLPPPTNAGGLSTRETHGVETALEIIVPTPMLLGVATLAAIRYFCCHGVIGHNRASRRI